MTRSFRLLLLALAVPGALSGQARRATRAARAATPPPRPSFTWSAVSAGSGYTCALDATGQAYCWGENVNRKLGIADSINIRRPAAVETPQRFTSISAGVLDTCALTREGSPVCWGGEETPTLPHSVMGSLRLRQLDLANGGCGIALDNVGWCWGANRMGQLGSGRADPLPSSAPERVAGSRRWQEVVTGGSFACGIATGGAAWCWGSSGERGDGSRANASTPVEVSGHHVFTSLAAGLQHVCGIADGGKAWCWGDNNNGALGSSRAGMGLPVPVDGGLAFKALSAGFAFTCGLTTTGRAYCWGWNQHGVLGTGTAANSPAPVPVAGTLTFKAISAGSAHACAITEAGELYCWGDNADGELGVLHPQTCRPQAGSGSAVRSCAMAPMRVQDPR